MPTDRERMRTRFADSIDGLTGGLAATCALTVTAVSDATNALLDADLTLAERVIDASGALENDATTWEQRAFSLLPLQAPVAHDLRVMVGGLVLSATYDAWVDSPCT
ncbi:hypothetical protein [Rhodococcus sp. T7]|nr:hypothetical protein [Rhodococcus sp. T7]